jgi:A/G-specific adenine glycosylase
MTTLPALLLPWFRANKRDLPWRRTTDPYAILVSEFMLQQTRVAVVVDRFAAFLARFPTVGDLADAGQDDVLALWSGLGYYRRARNLHAAARAIRDRFHGRVPDDAARLRELPGIGRYTAAAVASIAFGRAESLVDGNVARVLSRLFRLRGDPRAGAFLRRLETLAASLVPADGTAGDWNEALMELGATVCLPRTPRCPECPLARRCGAQRDGRPAAYPARTPAPAAIRETVVRIAIERNGHWLLRRNGPGERPAGMFEFPALAIDPAAGAARAAAAAHAALGLALREARVLGTARHRILQRSITVRVFVARAAGGRLRTSDGPGAYRWAALEELGQLPISAATLRLAALLRRSAQPRTSSAHARRSNSSVPASTERPRVKAR